MNHIILASYYKELGRLIDKNNFFEAVNLLPYCQDMAQSANLEADFIYRNDGVSRYKSEKNKASIAHKILFDFSSKEAKIFAKGFHKAIFDKEYVIQSAIDFIKRSIDTDSSLIPITLISKETEERLKSNLNDSVFYNELNSFQERLGKEVIKIYLVDCDSTTTNIPVADIIDNEDTLKINFSLKKETTKIVEINSFSVFDSKFYRYRGDIKSGNSAYIDFGSSCSALMFADTFQRIIQKANEY